MLSQISQSSVERLCGAQVIVDLRCCVRELLENALDAGATEVSVRLRSLGRDPCVEVADNGSGVSKENFTSVCLAHSTSKISQFDDLYSGDLRTFGFRGEALASLCAISDQVLITTRTSDVEVAQVLKYGNDGALLDEAGRCGRPVGTTVEVQGFRAKLPVRFKEFLATHKRHLVNVVNLMQQYAVARPDVRMEIFHDAKIIFSSIGIFTDSMAAAEAVMNVRRSHFQMVEISKSLWELRGWVTARTGGAAGKSAMQFFFLNGKPVETSRRLVKHFNAIYRKVGNFADNPQFILFLTVDRKSVDINVTPDKRTVFLPTEIDTEIIDSLDEFLKTFLADASHAVVVRASESSSPVPPGTSSLPALENDLVPDLDDVPPPAIEDTPASSPPRKRRQVEPLRFEHSPATVVRRVFAPPQSEIAPPRSRASCPDSSPEPPAPTSARRITDGCSGHTAGGSGGCCPVPGVRRLFAPPSRAPAALPMAVAQPPLDWLVAEPQRGDEQASAEPRSPEVAEKTRAKRLPPQFADERQVWVKKEDFGDMEIVGQFNNGFIVARTRAGEVFLVDQHAADEKNRFEALNGNTKIDQQPLVVPKKLRLSPAQEQLVREHTETWRANGFGVRVNEEAAPGQKVEITAFPSLKGLGVERSAAFTVGDFMEVLEMLEEAAESGNVEQEFPTRRGDLWGVDSEFPRPLKIWYHLASRACRTAIMIGDSLTFAEMRKILDNLTTLKQPWNCPHGRPTFKHVASLGEPVRRPILTKEALQRVLNSQ